MFFAYLWKSSFTNNHITLSGTGKLNKFRRYKRTIGTGSARGVQIGLSFVVAFTLHVQCPKGGTDKNPNGYMDHFGINFTVSVFSQLIIILQLGPHSCPLNSLLERCVGYVYN